MIKILVLAGALAATATFAQAQTLLRNHAATVDLGSTRGIAYYVDEPDGYHVVATLNSGRSADAVRFGTVLTDGQSATVSIPGPAGAPAQAVTFLRSRDHLEVRQTADTADAPTQ